MSELKNLPISTISAEFASLELVYKGPRSEVSKATDKDGQFVCIKKLLLGDRERKEYENELRVLEKLRHHFIIKFMRAFQEPDGSLCLVLEWIDGGDLRQLIRSKRDSGAIPEEDIIKMFWQICQAIKHLHEHNIMHRDIKPANMLLMSSGQVRVTDLGLSRAFSSETMAVQTLVGTPTYLSPERIKERPYSYSSDVWALGCLLYELCALRPPFVQSGASLYQLGKKICSGQYEALPDTVSDDIQSIVRDCLNAAPLERPSIDELHSRTAKVMKRFIA